ncbi:acyltransferase [Acidithiobacillus thiooxidans]|uniref:acyltransferase n=1 Tax=Acidithiobacillus thiooxidans TaxID=930 RepID=UPI000AD9647F|nr:acyltransferase [Acidithiobacillus thiooxidans]
MLGYDDIPGIRRLRIFRSLPLYLISFIFAGLLFSSKAPATDSPSNYVWPHHQCLRYRSENPDLLIFGDSIFDGWSGYLLHVFPRALVDAKVSRQFSSVISDYQGLLKYRAVQEAPVIVLELGTNGPITRAAIEQFMALAGSKQVYWITPDVPRPWQAEVLSRIDWAETYYPNVHLVHWHQYAQGHPGWFWSDGVHPNWEGIQAEVGLLQETMRRKPS